ncbi:MAG: fluoride efflux transporter CrcB [Oleibacter sp.]|nr:fluoride efflux transporter CrcB [Thalassolituus sp.]
MTYFWIAFGGALGAVARFVVASAVFRWADRPFPYGTLSVNLLGSFAIGMAFVWIVEHQLANDHVRSLAMVGFLGAFTTFSTFSLESITLLQQARYDAFLGYIGVSVLGCLLATAAGIGLAKSLV